MLTIDIASLEPGVHHKELEPEADQLNLDPEKFKHLHVLVRLDCQDDRILVTLDARATAVLECDRTLEDFEEEIAGAYSLLFAPPGIAGEDDERYEEVQELLPHDREIDVTEAARDTLLLAIPQRQVAPGAEEADIQTEFGRDAGEEDAIDPRWEALRKLRTEEDES